MFTRRESLTRMAAAGALSRPAWGARESARPRIRLVVFDVGGTLVEDRGDVPALLRSAMEHHGVRSTPEEIGRLRGASKREVIRHFVERQPGPAGAGRDALIDAIHREFTGKLIEAYRSVPPVGGAEQAILRLRSSGVLVATTTGFDRAINSSIFRRLGWEKHFAAAICSDDVAQGRPAPYMLFHAMEAARVTNVAEVIAAGDTPLDLQAGNNAGLRAVIGVLSGAGTMEKLRAEPRSHILPSVARLPELLPRL